MNLAGSCLAFSAGRGPSTGRLYDVQYEYDVRAVEWLPVPGQTNIAPQSDTLTITNYFGPERWRFYRLGVRVP